MRDRNIIARGYSVRHFLSFILHPSSFLLHPLPLLLLACLIPRAYMAGKMGGICPDAVVYIQVAESFGKGLLHADHQFGLNLFPVVLMLLHRSGLDWELAGKLWNVAISCLTVLPLYGWVRRQFDDRLALAAGCLYAMHPELIRWSPEGIRDPTFWFFLVLSLYLLWRAAAEVRLRFYLTGGLAMAMAVMTRSEGLFLLVPLFLWSWKRGAGSGQQGAERGGGAGDAETRRSGEAEIPISPYVPVSPCLHVAVSLLPAPCSPLPAPAFCSAGSWARCWPWGSFRRCWFWPACSGSAATRLGNWSVPIR